MRKCLLAALAAIYAVASAEELPRVEDVAWQAACTLQTAYSCEGVTKPVVVRTALPDRVEGRYMGGIEVLLNSKVTDPYVIKLALTHEMVHYLQAMVGHIEIPGPAATMCAVEEEAWRVTNLQQVLYGHPEWVSPQWWRSPSYKQCWQFLKLAIPGGLQVVVPEEK